MTWSYVSPTASSKDQIRFWVQDTDPSFQKVTDEEIEFLFSRNQGQPEPELLTAAGVAERLAARYTGEVNVSADGISVSVGELKDRYDQLALSLREEWKNLTQSTPGDTDYDGFSYETFNGDVSVPPLMFSIGMHDNYEAGPQDNRNGYRDPLVYWP